jgi:AraC-like DNA-binding protein
MESLSFVNFISLIIVFISWLLIIYLMTAKTDNKTSNILLSLFLLVNAQDSSGLFAHYFLYPKFPGLGMLFNSSVFLKLPLLYLYILSVIYSNFKLKKKHLWHLSFWIMNLLVLTPRFFAVDFEEKEAFLALGKQTPEIITSYILIHLEIAVYFTMCFIAIKKYKSLLLENYSNASLFNYKWLFQLILLYAITAFIATFKNAFLFAHLETALMFSQTGVSLIALGIITWVVLKALHNPELFRGVNSNLQLVRQLVIENTDLVKEEDDINEIVLLKKHMNTAEPFLNATLTIDDLASQMEIPTKDLSILINHNLNQHFFDFVNSYRIKKAMQILQDPINKHLTILEILYDVGFNSKSSFNTAFKKQTHLTPTQYREKHLKSVA